MNLGLLLLVLAIAPVWAEGDEVSIVVVKEHGVSAASYAQPYVDKFVDLAAEVNQWPGAKGFYMSKRADVEAFLQTNKPQYGIFSLGAFLALREKYRMQVLGQVSASLVGGQQYFLISNSASDLKGCKGKPLATDHSDDPKLIERVVAAGQFSFKDFQLVPTQRPLQTIRKVLAGEATCALVDDAQLAELAHIEGASAIRTVWSSPSLPAMPLVAFPSASEAARKRFQSNLAKLCEDEAKSICQEVAIQSLRTAGDKDYAAVIAAYGK